MAQRTLGDYTSSASTPPDDRDDDAQQENESNDIAEESNTDTHTDSNDDTETIVSPATTDTAKTETGTETELVNINYTNKDKDETVYIGRGRGNKHILNSKRGNYGQYGNPHAVADVDGPCKVCHEDHTRAESIERYRRDFASMLQTDDSFRRAVEDLRGETLACWCKPSPCHGDVIIAYLRGEFDVEKHAAKPRYWASDARYTDEHPFSTCVGVVNDPDDDVEYGTPSPVDEASSIAHRVHVPSEYPYPRMVYHVVPPIDIDGRTVRTLTEYDPVFEEIERVAGGGMCDAWLTLAHGGDEVTIPETPSPSSEYTFTSTQVQVPCAAPWWPQQHLDRLLQVFRLIREVQQRYRDAPSCPGRNPVRGQSTREELLETESWRDWVTAFEEIAEWLAGQDLIADTGVVSQLEQKSPLVKVSASTSADKYPSVELTLRSGGGSSTESGVHAMIRHCGETRCACRSPLRVTGDMVDALFESESKLALFGVDPVWVRRNL